MDISGIASFSTSLAQARTQEAVGVTVLRKALDAQEQGALQLIASATLPSYNTNLGRSIDTFA